MDKIKKNWINYFIILIAFYIVPMLIKDTGSGMFILLIVIPLITLITSLIYGLRNTVDFIYPLIVAILFIPTYSSIIIFLPGCTLSHILSLHS